MSLTVSTIFSLSVACLKMLLLPRGETAAHAQPTHACSEMVGSMPAHAQWLHPPQHLQAVGHDLAPRQIDGEVDLNVRYIAYRLRAAVNNFFAASAAAFK